MPRKSPVRRAGRPPERREIDAFQPDDRLAPRDRRADRRHDARFARAAGRSGAASAFELFDTGGLFGASEDPLHELVVAGTARDRRRRSAGASWSTDAKGWCPGDEQIARELRETGQPVILAINKTDDKRAQRRGDGVLPARLRAGRSRFPPSTAQGVAELLDEIVEAAEARRLGGSAELGRRRAGRRRVASPEPRAPAEIARRDRRPAERRQVVAGQPAAARGARARQRHAGHDARRDRRRRSPGTGGTSASSTPPACGGRAASRAAARWSSSASRGAKEAIVDADVVALVIDASDGRRPIRTRRSAAKRIAPAAASSSSRTSGTW